MKKKIGLGIGVLILIGLILFASLYKYKDNHLKIDGYRVRLENRAIIVDGCDYKDVSYCQKNIKVNNEDEKLEFSLVDFKEDGYPRRFKASINGHVFYEDDNIDIQKNGAKDYKVFLNFYVMNEELIMFSLTKGSGNRNTSLYAIDLDGNIVFNVNEVDEDFFIKDYEEFVFYEDNTFKLYTSKLDKKNTYNGEDVCNLDADEVIEAYYFYTYKDGKFTKKIDDKITVADFIQKSNLECSSK